MTVLVVHPQEAPLVGSVPIASDDGIAQLALLLAALCNGKSRVRASAGGMHSEATRGALEAMGVEIANEVVTGVGLFGLRAPSRDVDCGSSERTMRLLCGVLAAQPFASTLVGGGAVTDFVGALRARGARIDADDGRAVRVAGLPEGEYLGPLEHELTVASADDKSALLLSGLYAHGPTTLREPVLTPDHTERMLLALGVPLRTLGTIVELDPAGWSGSMPAFDVRVPGDLSAAAFIVGAALVVPGSRVTVRGVGTNPTRTGLLDTLRDMQAPLAIEPHGDENGEPVGDVHVENVSRDLVAGAIGGERVTRGNGEIPALCAIAARAPGITKIRDAASAKAMLEVLRAFGVSCGDTAEGLEIEGADAPLRAAVVDSRGDPRVAMSAALLALAGDGPSRVTRAEHIGACFPRFVGTLRALGARIDVHPD